MAGAMLSFGGLLSEVLQGGAAGLTASNPGIVKILGGFVFPVGLVMSVSCQVDIPQNFILTGNSLRIVLQGQELLTSNMMASFQVKISLCFRHLYFPRPDFPHGCCSPPNSMVEFASQLAHRYDSHVRLSSPPADVQILSVFFGNLAGSLFFAAILTHCMFL